MTDLKVLGGKNDGEFVPPPIIDIYPGEENKVCPLLPPTFLPMQTPGALTPKPIILRYFSPCVGARCELWDEDNHWCSQAAKP